MTDIVLTLPQSVGLEAWIAEGDPAGAPWSGHEWAWHMGGAVPAIMPGERVYICYRGKLRGYAPLVRIERTGPSRYSLVRRGGAVPVTIADPLSSFRGFRYRFWVRSMEVAFPDWTQA